MPKRNFDAAFVPANVIQRTYAIHERTLRTWADTGVLRHVRYHGKAGRRLYHLPSLRDVIGDQPTAAAAPSVGIVYARVSSAHQKKDLERQAADLKKAFPDHELVTDVGSGLNFKRKGLTAILDRVVGGMVKEIVVMHKDRLCRFGAELVEYILKKFGTKLVVHCDHHDDRSDNRELADDLIAVTTVFVARHNGLRSGANRRRRAQESAATATAGGTAERPAEESEAACGEGAQDPHLSHA